MEKKMRFVTMGEIMLRMTRPDYQRIIQGSYMTASSTEVRNSIKNGLITYPLINGEVEKIIKENNLYSS